MAASMISSCTYDNEEELYPMGPCDTTQVTYHETIAKIIMDNCFECHSLANVQISQIPLEGYANLKAQVTANKLIGVIRHQTGFSPMPKQRPPLNECDILKIERWVLEGTPE